jgi:pimeloyl-ACP methyl ester carboxylesterase
MLLVALLVQYAVCFQQQQRSSASRWSTTSTKLHETRIESYTYKDWNLTYRYKEAAKAKGQGLTKQQLPLVLIHPVGIGLDSWFWEKIMNEWNESSVYAPDLIGCGTQNGGDAWNPSQKALSFPLGWAQGIEPLLPPQGCTVVVQGGLAPVGVILAARNPTLVQKLVLCSPPTYNDMTTAIPESDLQRNFQFLTNPFTANPAFGLLESEWALRFFSNTFLFSNPCDTEWVDRAMATVSPELRTPVAAFNAGLLNHRSFEEELVSVVTQPTLILSGEDDKRDRQEYVDSMTNCEWQKLSDCCNVLPWEDPEQVCQALYDFLKR